MSLAPVQRIAVEAMAGTGVFAGRGRAPARERRVIPWWRAACCCGRECEFRQIFHSDDTPERTVSRGECDGCGGLFWFELRLKHVDDGGCLAYHYVKLDCPPGSRMDAEGRYR